METGGINYEKGKTMSIYKQFKDSLGKDKDVLDENRTLYSYWIYVKTKAIEGIVSIHSENKELDEYELNEQFEKEYKQCVEDMESTK